MSSLIPISETIISNNTGLDAITRAPIVDYETKVRCLRIQNVSHDEPFEMWGYTEVSEQNYKNFQLQKDDIIISRTGGSIGTLMYIDKDYKSVYNNGLICLKIDKERYNPRYIYYCLKLDGFKKHIQKCSLGNSTQENIRMNDMLEYMIPDFNLTIQNQIVDVLKDLDDKIQNNNAINVELESMAKTIYDYWFLQFEFPNEEGKPYKSSGGKMVWNEELKREIPEGWEVTYLSELCDFNNGINYDKDELGDKNYSIINVRNITSSTLLLDKSDFDIINLKSSQADKYLVEKDDILIARSGTPGAVRLLESDIENIIYCGFIIRCKPLNPVQRYYLAYSLKLLEGSNATKTGGSIMQNVSQDTLKQINICIPDDDVIEKYNNSISVILSKMQNVIEENRELTSLRDFLLPLLMNGQVGFK